MYLSRIREAFDIMKDRDAKDTPFLALALQLGSSLWSNDKNFKNLGLVPVYTTESLIELLRNKGVWW